VSILEKGWAKLLGSYARTEGGFPEFALAHLVGSPAESFNHTSVANVDAFFETLLMADKKRFTMIATKYDLSDIISEEKGWISWISSFISQVGDEQGHAWSLISVHETKDKNGDKVRLLKLRNPWGQGEW
jgi:hypothetical protein